MLKCINADDVSMYVHVNLWRQLKAIKNTLYQEMITIWAGWLDFLDNVNNLLSVHCPY